MQLTEQQVADIFADVKPALIEQLKKEMSSSIEYKAKQTVSDIVGAELEVWCKENVIPALRERLAASKEGIVAAAIPAAEAIATELGKSLVMALTKKLSEDYSRAKVFESLFGRGY